MRKNVFALCLFLVFGKLNAQTVMLSQKNEPQTWQEQVDFAKKQTDKPEKGGLKLIGYKYLGKIESQKQLDEYWKYMSADDTKVVSYQNEDGSAYDIVSLQKARKQSKELYGKDFYEGLKQQLDTIAVIGKELIQLDWEYKGEPIHSLGLISQGKIVFDYIATLAPSPANGSHRIKNIPESWSYRTKDKSKTQYHRGIERLNLSEIMAILQP